MLKEMRNDNKIGIHRAFYIFLGQLKKMREMAEDRDWHQDSLSKIVQDGIDSQISLYEKAKKK